MADNSELDKMRLAAMMNKSPATGGLKATNTVTPSFSMNTPIEQAYSRWKQDNSIAAKLLRGEQMSGEDIAKDLSYQLEAAMKDPTSFLGTIKAVGNLNLVPRIAKETLKGPETQTLQSFMNQVKQTPGVTKEGLKSAAAKLQYIKPDTPMTKAEFEKQITPSAYHKVSLESTGDSAYNHYRQQAEDYFGNYLSDSHLEHANVPDAHVPHIFDVLSSRQHSLEPDPDIIAQNKALFNEMPKSTRDYLKKEGVTNVDELDEWYDHIVHNNIDDYIEYNHGDELAAGNSTHRYKSIQRLIPEDSPNDYFELGVTHPAQKAEYKHYDSPGDPTNLIGHIRGSHITESTPLTTGARSKFNIEPGSSIIEEIQSDANKISDQTGHLHQVHGTLAKAAIQDALEKGSHTVYMPTSRAIGAGERNSPGGEYASIYDDAIVREALGPLQQVPGVKITPPTETPYSYPWSKYHHEDALNVLGIPKKQHKVADLFLNKNRPWFEEERFATTTPKQMIDKRIEDFQDQLRADTNYLNSKRITDPDTLAANPDNQYMLDSFTLNKFQKLIKENQDNITAHQDFVKWIDENFPGDTSTQNTNFNRAISNVLKKRDAEIDAAKQSTTEMPYHKIEFSPEAIEHILKGPGQTAPGYKQGGTIHQDKMNYAVHMAGGGQPNNKFSYASGLADLAGLDEEYYNANTIPLQHFDKSTEHNGPADAMRHMLFQAQITKNHSPTLAKIISQGHERLLDWGQPDAEQAMDFHNDALGREIGAKAKSIDEMTQMAKDAIMSGRAKVIGHDLPGKYYKLGGNVKNVSTNTGNHGNIALTTAQIRANLLRKKHG